MSLTNLELKRKKQNKNYPIIETSKKWVRVKLNNEIIAESFEPILLIEYGRGKMTNYFFKKEEVKQNYLESSEFKGKEKKFEFWNVRVGDRFEKNAAYSYDIPLEGYEDLEGLISFKWNSMDNWYEEDEEIFLHPRDPYHRVDTIPSSRHVRIEINGVTIAESNKSVFLFETGLPIRYYLPQEDIKMNLLKSTLNSSYCPYKGWANYWSVSVDNEEFQNVIWGYQDPISEIPKIKGHLAFWNEKSDKIKIYVNGKKV